ncbi:response regulator transcription factor [Luteimonas sp. SMYT11W]|uniref:Response regulator transcription factor n=1 Tax=Luteimonas flava TaxID=3115822 RepID=A0ABU7WG19_9GAMM
MHTSRNDNGVILIVEDDANLASLTGEWLVRRGFAVDYAHDGIEALNLVGAQRYDAILLDVTLPRMNGVEVCRQLRAAAHPVAPILMLSALNTLDAKLAGLGAGADDYLIKPFAPAELGARIDALLRRSRAEVAKEIIALDDLRVDPGTGCVTRAGRELPVLPVGLKILATLMRHHPRVVTRAELQSAIWGSRLPRSDSLRSHMYQLRRTLNDGFDEHLIVTMPGTGFRLRAPRPDEPLSG